MNGLPVSAMTETTMQDTPDTLERIYAEYAADHAFDQLRRNSQRLVKGDGPTDPLIIFIGEAPGKEEDKSGKPFVGRSGKELDRYLESIGVNREDVFITNIVKYRPQENRDPNMGEIINSKTYLERELAVLSSAVVCTLGRHSLSVFFPELGLNRNHGQVQKFGNKFLVPLYHPAVGLHNPPMKPKIEADFQKVGDLLDSLVKSE